MIWIIIILLALILAALIFGGRVVGTAIAVIIGVIVGIPILIEYGLHILAALGGFGVLLFGGILWLRAKNRANAAKSQAEATATATAASARLAAQQRPARGPSDDEKIQILVREHRKMRESGQHNTPRAQSIEAELQRLGWK